MRAFIAIDLPQDVRTSLSRLQHQLAASEGDVKWTNTDQLHLTLKFLDEITDDQRRAVERLLGRIGATQHAFPAQLHTLGAFPSLASPRVIWVGLRAGEAQILQLAQAIEEGCLSAGLRREERPFSAHVTLGRVRSPKGRDRLVQSLTTVSWTAPPPWHVTALTFFQSVLGADWPTHTVLAEVPLAG